MLKVYTVSVSCKVTGTISVSANSLEEACQIVQGGGHGLPRDQSIVEGSIKTDINASCEDYEDYEDYEHEHEDD